MDTKSPRHAAKIAAADRNYRLAAAARKRRIADSLESDYSARLDISGKTMEKIRSLRDEADELEQPRYSASGWEVSR